MGAARQCEWVELVLGLIPIVHLHEVPPGGQAEDSTVSSAMLSCEFLSPYCQAFLRTRGMGKAGLLGKPGMESGGQLLHQRSLAELGVTLSKNEDLLFLKTFYFDVCVCP